MGSKLVKAKPFEFTTNGDQYGWEKADNGNWFMGLYIEGGRVLDTDDFPMMTGLREIAKVHDGDFRLTGNQNLIIGNVAPGNKRKIDSLLKKYGLLDAMKHSSARLNSIACVALNTCDQAFSEAERYLPSLMDRMDKIIKAAGLWDDPIVVRMTGCPNGCGRPYVAEIGFTGKAVGKYNLYLGAGFHGERLNKMYKENIGEDEIIETLEPMIHAYAKKRKKDERFGDFCVRTDIIKATREGMDFHD
jgi:sulfite reductase (NADPH) hemoprotein beta-component